MHRYAIGIEFCGTRYRGWQTQQAGVPSIQQTIETALSQLANSPIILHAAGRTDAGVHASNMIAHFDTSATRSLYAWQRGTNSLLPDDIAITWIIPTDNLFHARFGALSRRYLYVLCPQSHRSALLHHQVTHIYEPLQIDIMQQACLQLVGEHDFSSFRASACQSNQPIRHVIHASLSHYGSLLVFDIEANGFLHHMVRNIIGALLDIGTLRQHGNWIHELLMLKDRRCAGVTAPADGLYFANAQYAAHFNIPQPKHIGPIWLTNYCRPNEESVKT